MAPRKRFAVASGTLPSAEDLPDAVTPVRQDVQTPRTVGPSPEPAKRDRPARSAFTWRLTAEQAVVMDDLTIKLKRQLGRPKIDRAEMLSALVGLANESPAVFGALAARLG